MKAIISNRIYLSCPPEGFDSIKKALTYKIEKPNLSKISKTNSIEIIRNYKLLPRNILSIPQGRQDLIPKGYEIIDKRVYNWVPFPEPNLPLRPEQEEVYVKVEDSCFLNALVGWGKTFTALYIARKLGQKTLIVTHTTALRDQWVQELEKLYNMKAGVIGGSQYDIDHPIVIGNVQSVTKFSLELSKEFGLVILDEAHHCPAETFGDILDRSYARYRIGLSGTMIRKDGKHILFKDYFGETVYRPPQSNTLNPIIRILRPGISLEGDIWAKKINNLLYNEDYQQYIATVAATQISLGHKVLIVASRIEFLQNVKELLGETCMLVTGACSTEERDNIKKDMLSGKINCIAGSRQIFTEGISVDPLSCLILPEPIANHSNLEQLIGRIMRKYPDKLQPLVLDIHFSSYTDKRQNNIRLGLYIEKGWDIASV